jgi:hypothetical protein
MKKILFTIPLLFCSCFLPATESVFIRFPAIPDPWAEYWTGLWDIALTDGTEIRNYSLVQPDGFSVEVPCARAWIIRVRPVLACRVPGPEAACRLDSTEEEAFPLWSGAAGVEVLLGLNDPLLVQTLNLERFFMRLNQLEDPQFLDKEKLGTALQNGTINHYSFDEAPLFPVSLNWPLGSWIAGNWHHPVEKVISAGLPAGVHEFFDMDGERLFLVTIGETGNVLASSVFPSRMTQEGISGY